MRVPVSAKGVTSSAKRAHSIWFLRKWESYTSAPGKHYFSNKTCFSATIAAPRATSEGGTCFPSPSHLTKKKGFGRGELSCSPPSSSNLRVGQYKLCPQPGGPPLESALFFPPLFLVPSIQPSTEVPLTQCSSNPQCPPPIVPQPKDLSTLGHRHGLTPDHERGGSAFNAKMGCPLHNQGKNLNGGRVRRRS